MVPQRPAPRPALVAKAAAVGLLAGLALAGVALAAVLRAVAGERSRSGVPLPAGEHGPGGRAPAPAPAAGAAPRAAEGSRPAAAPVTAAVGLVRRAPRPQAGTAPAGPLPVAGRVRAAREAKTAGRPGPLSRPGRSSRATPPTADRPASSPRVVLAVASLGVFMAFVDATVVNIAFPDIERSFPTVSLDGLQWILNAYNIVFAAFLVVAGRLADVLGRRRLFRTGIVTFTLASLACTVAPSVDLLVAARIAQAVGAAIVVPSSLALVLASAPVAERTRAVALWTACAALAAGIGPSLGALLVEAGGWRLVFLVNLPVGVVALVLGRRRLLESREPDPPGLPDAVGALLLTAAVASLVLGVVQGGSWGWTSPGVLGAFAAAAAIAAAFARRSLRRPDPLFDIGLLRIRSFSVLNGSTLVGSAGFYAYTLCNVLFLTSVWRWSIVEAGLAVTPGPLVAIAIAGPASRLVARHGLLAVIVPGGIVWVAGALWFAQRAGATPDLLGVWLPGMVLLGIGAGLTFPNMTGAAVTAASGERLATATALNAVSRQLGAAIGIALVVALIGTPAPQEALAAFGRGWTFAAACIAVATAGCLVFSRAPARRVPTGPRGLPRTPVAAGSGD